MLETLSIQELIASIEKVSGKILIPDAEVNWLWDSLNHQYYNIDEVDRALILECLQAQTVKSEIRKSTDSQPPVYVENIYIPVIPDHGLTRLIIKLSVDVTQKILSEQRLFEERNKYAQIALNSPEAIFTLNEWLQIQSLNKGAMDIFGYAAHELIGQHASVLFQEPGELEKTIETLIRNPIESGVLKNHLTRCKNKNHFPMYSEMTLFTVQIDHSGTREWVLMLRDITRQKKLEDDIARSLDNIIKINEISGLIHSTLNINEILNMILVAVTAGQGFKFNRAFLFLISDDGLTLEGRKAIGPSNPHEAGILWSELSQKPQTLAEIMSTYKSVQDGRDFRVNQMIASLKIPIIDDPAYPESHEYAAFTDAVRFGECILIRPMDNHYLTATIRRLFETEQLAIIPLISKDGVIGVLVVDNAITGREIVVQDLQNLKIFANQISIAIENAVLYEKLQHKVAELEETHEYLRRSQEKLIRSERLAVIGELSAKMAHEIRNPLVAIGGFARTIFNKGNYHKENEQFLKIILEETKRLEGILNATLNYARNKEPELKRQAIKPIVEHVLTLLSQRIANASILIERHYDDIVPDLNLDSDMIVQVVINIIMNAVEAMAGGGVLSITIRALDQRVALFIRDTGEGMTKEQVEKIFDPFFTTKQRGSGLGLMVVMDFLDHHNAEYHVESEKGKGTEFRIFFRLPE